MTNKEIKELKEIQAAILNEEGNKNLELNSKKIEVETFTKEKSKNKEKPVQNK